MKFILGKKIGMTQVFSSDGAVVPVTRVQAGPCQIVGISKVKTAQKEATSVQLGFGEKKEWRLKKPLAGHLKNLQPVTWLKSFITDESLQAERGDMVAVDTFVTGDKVAVIGVSKGKGFAGVVKRHHFAGGPASHGHKDNLRMPGSIGAGGVQRVFKGMRMAGRMGGDRVTVKNLEIIEVHPETNELYIKGAVPGGRNGLLLISCPGDLKITKNNEKQDQSSAVPEVAVPSIVENEVPVINSGTEEVEAPATTAEIPKE
jgi:large subunit ribosomal protein L3